MGIKYLWDTNTVIYYLQQQFNPEAEKFVDSIIAEYQPAISAITEIELLCWKSASEKDIEVMKSFISDCFVIELEQAVKFQTAEIRKSTNIKLPDAIIAASALAYNLTVLTRNTRDFESVKGLAIESPWKDK